MRWFRPPPLPSSRPFDGGGRSSILAFALCALMVAWWLSGTRRGPSDGAPAAPSPDGLPDSSAHELVSIENSPRARARAAGGLPAGISAEPSVPGALIDVRGRVLAGGLPAAEQEIELVPLAGTRARAAWDLTDEYGLYQVELAPGRYGVLLDGILAPGAVLEVPADGSLVCSNLTLADRAPAE